MSVELASAKPLQVFCIHSSWNNWNVNFLMPGVSVPTPLHQFCIKRLSQTNYFCAARGPSRSFTSNEAGSNPACISICCLKLPAGRWVRLLEVTNTSLEGSGLIADVNVTSRSELFDFIVCDASREVAALTSLGKLNICQNEGLKQSVTSLLTRIRKTSSELADFTFWAFVFEILLFLESEDYARRP